MFCRNCGREISDEAVICPHCGVQVGEFKTYTPPVQNYDNGANATNNENKDNILAIVGFVMSFFVAIAGLICSILGYKHAKKDGAPHKKLALAGIIISAVAMGINLLGLIFDIVGIFSGSGGTIFPGIGDYVLTF